MIDQYADIAEKYKKSKYHPWRIHIEEFTLFQLLGDLTGKTVLDLACGEGFYTRRLRQRGAARVVGVDISPPMIELARAEEARHPLGIEYVIQDAARLELPERFDLVVAAYLLNYSANREQLLAMTQAIARHLKPGSRFVTVNDNVTQPVDSYARSRKYGLIKHITGELREGAPVNIVIFEEDGRSFRFENPYLSPQTYEWALQTAGLTNVHWQSPQVSPRGEADFGKDHWADFLAYPPVIFLDCTKG